MLDIYEAIIDGDRDGVYALSLVDYPATEEDWITFAEQDKKDLKFAIANEDKHLIYTVVMKANTPIYRRNGDYEYYIVYSKETIRTMAQKMLADNTVNNFDLMHNGAILGKGLVSIQELYIVDESKGIIPNFMEVPDGSLMCTLKVNDETLWQMCKDGTFNGISLAGWFTVKEIKQNNNNNKFMTMKDKIITALKSLIAEFGSVVAADGTEITFDGDVLEVGVAVNVEDGEYVIEDKIYVVSEGKVSEIKDIEEPVVEEPTEAETEEPEAEPETMAEEEPEPEVEEPEVEEPEAEEPSEVDALKEEIATLKSELADLKALVESLRESLAQPAAEPVAEQFEKTLPKNTNKKLALAEAMKG